MESGIVYCLAERRASSKDTLKRLIPVMSAYLMIFALLKWPENTKEAAQRAMEQWYYGVAPVLFPFMMLMPLITSPDAAKIYQTVFGRTMGFLFGLPGEAVPVVVIGMVAGSPACAAASVNTYYRGELSKGQLTRLAGCMCGMSPAFLLSVVGDSLFNSTGVGIKLLISQAASQYIMLIATRNKEYRERTAVKKRIKEESGNSNAVLSVLTVAGYMVIFNILASIVSCMTSDKWGNCISCLLEVTAGSEFVAGTDMTEQGKLIVLAAMFGFGGTSICAQNMKILSKCGITLREYLPWRIASAFVSSTVMVFQTGNYRILTQSAKLNWLEIASVSAVILGIPAIFGVKKHIS